MIADDHLVQILEALPDEPGPVAGRVRHRDCGRSIATVHRCSVGRLLVAHGDARRAVFVNGPAIRVHGVTAKERSGRPYRDTFCVLLDPQYHPLRVFVRFDDRHPARAGGTWHRFHALATHCPCCRRTVIVAEADLPAMLSGESIH